ncbi:thermonuclease family protein [Rhodobacteraceae bacterium]|nr:thermonuclease family protein [Paracoccaceae bacterium]
MFRFCTLLVCGVLGASVVPTALMAKEVRGPARVVDGDTLVIGDEILRLHGIDAPERAQDCTRSDGRTWACGAAATEAMKARATGVVSCRGTTRDRYGRLVAVCSKNDVDLGAALVEDGLAIAYRQYSTDYIGQEKAAMIAKRGIWSGPVETPAHWRAHSNDPTGDCAIKGNISSNGHLYHVPGMRSYAATKIDEAKGERWFCTEDEARAAGWTAADTR